MKTIKNIYKISVSLLILFILIFSTTQAQQDDFKRVGRSGFSFLKITPSARAAGMGNAFTAISDDVTAVFYNPAGLSNLDYTEYSFSYTRWIVNSKLMSGVVGFPIGTRYALAFSIISFSVDDFEETTVVEPEGTGRMIQAGDIAVGISGAVKLTDRLTFGLKTQYIEENIDMDKARGLGIDFATYYRTGYKDLVIAMAMKNFGPKSVYLSDKFKLPLYFNINTAFSLIGSQNSPVHLTVSAESAFATDYRDRYHVGGELWIADMVSLRSGYKFFYDTEDWTVGIGLKLKIAQNNFLIDLAYTNYDEYFNPPIRLSLGGSI
ncbi:MAG: PorV/PorQ family protein [Candidatus Marinimicrobia bacterium]|nr:PorV/PorQ family protein [Candidatus Neomarinimicrobiota bacterium]